MKIFLLILVNISCFFTLNSYSQNKNSQNKSGKTRIIIEVINAQQDGAVVPNAKVTLQCKKNKYEGVTDNMGIFKVEVSNSSCKLIVESYGFSKYLRKKIKLIGAMELILHADLIPVGLISH